MSNKSMGRNGYLTFSPLFLYYIYFIVKHRWPSLYGDEPRYINFATNLLHGFYSPPMPHINLWNGPGYPIVLMPFIAVHLPFIYLSLINALFLYLSVVFLYLSASFFIKQSYALFLGLVWGFYPNSFSFLLSVLTEAFTVFLITSFLYCIVLLYVKRGKKYILLSGFLLGYITLTKIIFGYVLVGCLFIMLILLITKRTKNFYLKSVYILLIAIALTIPYLLYTYNLTGKPFYWGNSGGMSLYWMSTPDEQEYGDWKVPELVNTQFPILYSSTEGDALLKFKHNKEISFILKHDELTQDELFKKLALNNIKHRPRKFIRNYYYNLARLLFDVPYSYVYQNTGIISNIITGSLILWASLITAFITCLNWRNTVYPIKFSLLITAIYLFLTGALSAYPRQFDIIVPVLLFWIAITISRMPKVSFYIKNINPTN